MGGDTRTRSDRNRLILRAELHRGGRTTVTYAIDVTHTSAFVATDWLADVGSAIELELSFPRLLERVKLSARVAAQCAPSGPGAPSGLQLSFARNARLSELLDSADRDVSAAPKRILLVEDNGFIRDVFEYGLRAFFQARGLYSVDQAESAESAWQRLDAASYDIAIIDHYLPADNGATLIERMRSDRRMSDLPIVAVSVGGRDAHDACISAGADLFLDKPLVFRDLFNTLRVLAQAGANARRKQTVLVFDDSPMVLELTRAALEAAGFSVLIAETLATFEQHRGTSDPDLILIDVQMPEAFGDDVVLALHDGHGVRVPILLVSSLDEDELARRAERAHAAGYVQKSAGVTELVRRCKQALGASV